MLTGLERGLAGREILRCKGPDNPGMTPAESDAVAPVPVVLATINARYIHASMGLRCLLANMDVHGRPGLRAQTVLREFTLVQSPQQMAEALLDLQPQVIGLGVYIWNAAASLQLVRLLKALAPQIKIVLGGPEVSHEVDQQEICRLADHVITGWGDVSFPRLCRALIDGPQPLMKVIAGEQPDLSELALPYEYYSDRDLQQRHLYVEASRGCPYQCEFCLSALDKTAWPFEVERLLSALADLFDRGARQFRFVDRTFNLRIDLAARILTFFLDRLRDQRGQIVESAELFVHFELIPDRLPDALKALIVQFPPGCLQFEVGVQTFDPQVQQRISRRQDIQRTLDNLRWLVSHSQAHLHADLIFGLPGETLESFAAGFDQLQAIGVHEIQLGLLKRLRGAPIDRHTDAFGMVYDSQPPYALLRNDCVDFATVQRFSRLARYWDLLGNGGRFSRSLQLLMQGASAFAAFLDWSDWLWRRTGKTHQFSQESLVDLLSEYLVQVRGLEDPVVQTALLADYKASGARGKPASLALALRSLQAPGGTDPSRASASSLMARQARHSRARSDDTVSPVS